MTNFRIAAFIVGTLSAATLGSGAGAADLPVKAPAAAVAAPFNWAGFYIGAHVGGGWASQDSQWDPLPSPVVFGAAPLSFKEKGSSFIGGVHAGYNLAVMPAWIAGIEADWTWSRLNDLQSSVVSTPDGVPAPPSRVDIERNVRWLASLRGRIGAEVTPQALLYVTGGVAFANVAYSGFFQNNFAVPWPTVSFSQTKTGYTLGGGLEWALTRNWLLRGEYVYYGFKGDSATAAPGGLFLPVQFSWNNLNINVVRAGLSYKF